MARDYTKQIADRVAEGIRWAADHLPILIGWIVANKSVIPNCLIGLVGGGFLGFIVGLGVAVGALNDVAGGQAVRDLVGWSIVSAGALIGFSVPIIYEWHCRRERQAEQRAAEQQARDARTAHEHAVASRLSTLMSHSASKASSLPALVRQAEDALDRAENEFGDGAYAPFWDAVEEAAKNLARFNVTVQRLLANASLYKTEAATLATALPRFQLGVQTLPDASSTAERMQRIVRQAQRNFEFATIYEHRKTNQLLVAGFSTLGQAMNELGDRIDASLDALGASIGIAIADASARASAQAESLREQLGHDAEERRDHERQTREMLDNIQRRRKPLRP